MSYSDVTPNQPIVIDNGSGIIKCGFAGDEYPKFHFPSYIGRPKHVRVMAGALEGDLFIGPKAKEHRGLLNIKYPIEHGIVTDWNDMEQIWTYIYSKEALAILSEDHPVLLTEAPLNPRKNRLKAAEILFETFNVPALYISMQAVLSLAFIASARRKRGSGLVPIHKSFLTPLSRLKVKEFNTSGQLGGVKNDLCIGMKPDPLFSIGTYTASDKRPVEKIALWYATGRTTGVVLDSGDGVTHCVPIYEGFALPHSILRSDVAGRDVTRYLQLLLRREGYIFKSSSEFEVVKSIKENVCHISLNSQKDEQQRDAETIDYPLPDGSVISIGRARYRAPELLFQPYLIGEESNGIHEVLCYSIRKSDLDLRKIFYSNIVLSGGSTLFKGFGDRLLSEMKKQTPRDIKIRISAPQERLYSTWMGGSILAALDTFKRMWVSKKEYEEDSARAIERKTF